MACTKPLVRWELLGGQKTKNGKAVIVWKEPTDSPSQKIEIPCGQCLMCRIDKAKEWQKRIVAEISLWEHNYFVTLTYDNKSVPWKTTPKIILDKITGEILDIKDITVQTLNKPDMVKFNKDMRQMFRKQKKHTGIRFFDSGEYGDKTQRPHYHRIYFNLPLEDTFTYEDEKNIQGLVYWGVNDHGQPMYRSPILEKIWKKGIVVVGTATYESAGYVARYVLKKQHFTERNEYREPEFINMSRNPGIGAAYYEQHKHKLYENDSMLIPKEFSNSFYTKPPAYFDEKHFIENKEQMEEVKKDRRRLASAIRKVKESNTSLYPDEQKLLEERKVKEKMSKLKHTL